MFCSNSIAHTILSLAITLVNYRFLNLFVILLFIQVILFNDLNFPYY